LLVNGVVGAVVVDSNGLVIASKGSVPIKTAGFFRSIATRAKELYTQPSAGSDDFPLVSVETDSHTVLIQSHANASFVLFKNQQQPQQQPQQQQVSV